MWPVPEVTIRLPKSSTHLKLEMSPGQMPSSSLKITARKQKEHILSAGKVGRKKTLKETEPRNVSSSPQLKQSDKSLFLREGAGRKGENFLSSQYFQKDRCFYFIGLSRDAWKGRKLFSLNCTGIFCQIAHIDI